VATLALAAAMLLAPAAPAHATRSNTLDATWTGPDPLTNYYHVRYYGTATKDSTDTWGPDAQFSYRQGSDQTWHPDGSDLISASGNSCTYGPKTGSKSFAILETTNVHVCSWVYRVSGFLQFPIQSQVMDPAWN
jgi:hypothetical protein